MRRLLVLLALAGCPAGEDLTFVTYNAGLSPGFLPRAPEERAPVTAQAIAEIEADVVCLQEVWLPRHADLVREAAAERFPHQFFPDPKPVVLPEPACAVADLKPFATCLETHCADVCADEQLECLTSQCGDLLVELEPSCQRCTLVTSVTDFPNVADICATQDVQYAYGGSFGTGILSTLPIKAVEETILPSSTNRRSVLHATVEAPGGDVDVYCTHTTRVFDLPYPIEGGSWAEEQRVQILGLLDRIEEAPTGRVAALGSLNTGPAVGESVALQPESWALIEATDLRAPYVQAGGGCTLCPGENPLVEQDLEPVIADHILLSGFRGRVTVQRILEDEIRTESCGVPIDGAYSDHYGVQVTVRD